MGLEWDGRLGVFWFWGNVGSKWVGSNQVEGILNQLCRGLLVCGSCDLSCPPHPTPYKVKIGKAG